MPPDSIKLSSNIPVSPIVEDSSTYIGHRNRLFCSQHGELLSGLYFSANLVLSRLGGNRNRTSSGVGRSRLLPSHQHGSSHGNRRIPTNYDANYQGEGKSVQHFSAKKV